MSGARSGAHHRPSRSARAPIEILPLRPEDRAAWEPLARDYKAFYEEAPADEAYAAAWSGLLAAGPVHGLGAHVAGEMVGLAHYLFHANVWLGEVCYLQDLYVAEDSRGRGIARALIEWVAEIAVARGASRLYWQTKETNAAARLLYDRVARFNGFIRYYYPLPPGD